MGPEPGRVRPGSGRPGAPRSARATGARPRFGPVVCVLAVLAWAHPATAQQPDSLQVRDSLQLADSALVGEQQADSVSADTIFYNLPTLDARTPPGFATGVWEWDRDAIMASGANTIAELVAEVPGVVPLYGGDYGTPASFTAFGSGAGGYRVFRDGFELYPVDGGVVDLQRVGLAGVSRVRLDRSLGSMTVEIWSHRHDDGRPFSVVEAGTGDLDTNVFRGVYADPTAFGGSVGVGLERADTRGLGPDEGGNRTGYWVRYQLHLRDRAGVALDVHRMGSQTKVPDYASSLSRSDVTVRGRLEIVDGVVAEAYTGRSTLDAQEAGADFVLFGGSRGQHGVRLGLQRGGAWARGALRLYSGDLPSRNVEAEAGLVLDAVGGVSGAFSQSAWPGETTSSLGARGWLGPFLGLTVFGAVETGTFGARDGPVLDGLTEPSPPFLPRPTDDPPGVAVAERSTLRAGGSLSVLGATLAGALVAVDRDLDLPLGTELDLGAPPQAGLDRTGVEGWASLPMPLDGLHLVGSYQRWEEAGPYLPRQVYRGSLEYHRVHLESGNLELWGSLGVRGHDPMSVFVPGEGVGDPGGLTEVPFYQSWYLRLQVRVVTVRLFFGWENFTIRRNLQMFPGRELPFARSFFGLRWDMWN